MPQAFQLFNNLEAFNARARGMTPEGLRYSFGPADVKACSRAFAGLVMQNFESNAGMQ